MPTLRKLADIVIIGFIVVTSIEWLVTLALRAYNNIYNAWIHRYDEQHDEDEEHTQP